MYGVTYRWMELCLQLLREDSDVSKREGGLVLATVNEVALVERKKKTH